MEVIIKCECPGKTEPVDSVVSRTASQRELVMRMFDAILGLYTALSKKLFCKDKIRSNIFSRV